MAKFIIGMRHKEAAECMKLNYLGHSLGTTQTFYGLGRGKYMRPYFSQVVAIAPCFIPMIDNYVSGDFKLDKETYAAITGFMEVLDLESLFGPYWGDQVDRLCAVSGGHQTEACSQLKSVKVGPLAPGGSIFGMSEVSVQSVLHLAQNIV